MAAAGIQTEPGNRLSRREWLRQSATALASATAIVGLDRAVAADKQVAGDLASGAIDAHSHIWTPDVKRYPLARGFSPADMQPASFTGQELLAQARPCGVSRVVLIQMSYYGFDNSYMLDAMRDHPGVFSGVAVVDHHAKAVRDTVRDLKKRGVRGFRIHPATEPVEAWLSSDDMSALWRLGAEERLAMCALVNPEALAPLDKMCDKFPDTPLVIDHIARIGMDGTIRETDVDNLCRLARHKNVNVKVSAFYALGKKQSPYTDLAPMIRRLLGAFGRERLMWASDCPFQVVEGHNYRDSIELIRSRLDFLTDDDRAWMLGKTAQRVFFS